MDADGHLGDDLSALLDGELDEHEVGAAQAHLAACDRCRDELVAVQAGRDLLRGLPFVDPPRGFVDGLIVGRRRRRHQAVAVAVLASVATFVTLVAGGAYRDVPEVDAELASLEQAHAGSPMGAPTQMEDLGAPMDEVPHLAGLDRTDVHMGDELVQITYSGDDGDQLTVFEGYGRASDDWLEDARPMAVRVDGDTEEGFVVALDDARMLVIEMGDVVYALVGDRSDEQLAEAAEDLPDLDEGDGIVDRTQTVIVRIGEVFSP